MVYTLTNAYFQLRKIKLRKSPVRVESRKYEGKYDKEDPEALQKLT